MCIRDRITSLGMVMMPRIASLTSKNQHDLVKDTLKKSFTVISFLAVPIAFGIMGVSDRFIQMCIRDRYRSKRLHPCCRFSFRTCKSIRKACY